MIKRLFKSIFLLVAALSILPACTPTTGENESATAVSIEEAHAHPVDDHHVQAQTLDLGKAAAQAQSDFKNGKCRLYAAYGYVVYFPGTDDDNGSKPVDKTRFEVIYVLGTSDSGGPYNERGKAFARAYNQVAVKNCGQPT